MLKKNKKQNESGLKKWTQQIAENAQCFSVEERENGSNEEWRMKLYGWRECGENVKVVGATSQAHRVCERERVAVDIARDKKSRRGPAESCLVE